MGSIAIVGGAGFIGTRLGRRLDDSDKKFYIIDKQESSAFPTKTKIADVRDLEKLRGSLEEASVVFNLAAEHRDDVRPKSLYDEVNVGGARNLCKVAEEKGIKRIVFTSSVAVFGFAEAGTDESGDIKPFNDYGRTKAQAEEVFKAWQQAAPDVRSLAIIRPTVVFGEQNRGNVYNLLRQIASGRFVMIGHGRNRKSLAYVENVAAFLDFSLGFGPGIHVYNYVDKHDFDKQDFDMNTLVSVVRKELGHSKGNATPRLPYSLGYGLGLMCDLVAKVSGRSLPISSIRVKKFCSTTQFSTSVDKSGFVPPVALSEALRRTVRYEFLENHEHEKLFYSE